jgi:hypothetical protein
MWFIVYPLAPVEAPVFGQDGGGGGPIFPIAFTGTLALTEGLCELPNPKFVEERLTMALCSVDVFVNAWVLGRSTLRSDI